MGTLADRRDISVPPGPLANDCVRSERDTQPDRSGANSEPGPLHRVSLLHSCKINTKNSVPNFIQERS